MQEDSPHDQSIWARLDTTRFAEIAEQTSKAGVWNCSTLVVYQSWVAPGEPEQLRQMPERPEMRYVSPRMVQFWYPENNYVKKSTPERMASTRASDPVRKKLVKALHDAGARILRGTDYPNPFVVPGFSIHEELQNLVDAGLRPYEAIRPGTVDAAEFLGARAEFGTVSVGVRADLILLEGNPLEDVRHIRKPAGVMIRGRWFSQTELQDMLEKLAESHHAGSRQQQ